MKKYILFLIFSCFFLVEVIFSQCDDCDACSDKSKNSCKNVQSNKQSNEDEFAPLNPSEITNDDEFAPLNSNEITNDTSNNTVISNENTSTNQFSGKGFIVPLVGLFFTCLAGFFVRNKYLRKCRYLFLVSSAIYFGFVNGACPCPISSLSHIIIYIISGESKFSSMIWFLGLIPLTYLFGKTWCGWVCHLGALQEFIYKKNNIKFLVSAKAQRTMKIIRIVLLITLIIQLIYTHTYLFNVIDPFKIAYNLGWGANTTSWLLLGLLLISSIFIYRPFCKSACPIGLLLGLIAYLPGASLIGAKQHCISCNTGSKSCNIDAITRYEGYSKINNTDCIACGECIDSCSKNSLGFHKKNNEYKTVMNICMKEEK